MRNRYNQATAWLFQQFPSYQHLGAPAYKPGLDNTRKLLASLGNPETTLRFIHVAGTNGKGSTCAFIASFLQQAGFRVGLFTSPHLIDFRERIRVNGKPISEESVVEFTHKIQSQENDLSFFEITLGMALVHFQQESCDYVVLETGMGGRLDATNIVTPILSVITHIGLDHQAFLGETLAQIAEEKAGIIKPGIPVLCGEARPNLQEIFQRKAARQGAPWHFHDEYTPDPAQKLPKYQRKNAALAREALHLIGIDIPHIDTIKTWENLFDTTGFLGRLFPSSSYEEVWYDVSHNADGLSTTLDSFEQMGKTPLIVVFGASNDKSLAHLSMYQSLVAAWYFCSFNNARSYTLPALTEEAKKLSLHEFHGFESVDFALDAALKHRRQGQAILVTGSFFLLSDCAEIQEKMKGQLYQ